MIKLLKDIASFVPRIIRHRKWLNTEALRLNQFKDLHRGEDCFIIGNGPSLNKMDLNLLNNYYTIGLNKIFLLFKKTKLKIDYHVCVNRFVIEQSTSDFLSLHCPSFISYKHRNKQLTNNERIFFVGDMHSKWGFFEDITKGICQGNTVTYVAMQLAFFLGFERVFLIGVDHSFVQKGSPHKIQTLKGEDINHFDPDYFKGLKWQLPDLEGSELAYKLAKKHFEDNGRSVFDATVDGKLNVFKKLQFDEALVIAQKKKDPKYNDIIGK